jgi:hypothetical protein
MHRRFVTGGFRAPVQRTAKRVNVAAQLSSDAHVCIAMTHRRARCVEVARVWPSSRGVQCARGCRVSHRERDVGLECSAQCLLKLFAFLWPSHFGRFDALERWCRQCCVRLAGVGELEVTARRSVMRPQQVVKWCNTSETAVFTKVQCGNQRQQRQQPRAAAIQRG